MEGCRRCGPILNGDIGESGSFFQVEVVHPTSQGGKLVGGLEVVQDRDAAVLSTNDERVRKNGTVVSFGPMENLDRQSHRGIRWHVEKGTSRHSRLVQGRELARPQCGWLGHEVFPKKVCVVCRCGFQGFKNHTFRERLS